MKLRLSRVPPRWILVATVLVVIAYAFPGYMNWDADDQLHQARGLLPRYDWHPPIMAAYWKVVEYVVHGPFGLLVIQTLLFTWGL